jgi:hypothetical protein
MVANTVMLHKNNWAFGVPCLSNEFVDRLDQRVSIVGLVLWR